MFLKCNDTAPRTCKSYVTMVEAIIAESVRVPPTHPNFSVHSSQPLTTSICVSVPTGKFDWLCGVPVHSVWQAKKPRELIAPGRCPLKYDSVE